MIQNLAAFISGTGRYEGPHLPTVVRDYETRQHYAVIAIEVPEKRSNSTRTYYIVARSFEDVGTVFVTGLIVAVDQSFAPYMFGVRQFNDALAAWDDAGKRAKEE